MIFPPHLFGVVDAAQVLAGQGRAAQRLLSVLPVTLENFLLQIRANGMRLISPGEREKGPFGFLQTNRSEEKHFKVIKKCCL